MVTVKEAMHEITVVDADDSVHNVAMLMDRKNIGSVLVRTNGKLNGIITERDLMKRVVARALDPKRTHAREIMSPLIYTINHDADVLEASEIFKSKNIRRLPVTKGGEIIGVVTARNISDIMPFAFHSMLSRVRRPESGFMPAFF